MYMPEDIRIKKAYIATKCTKNYHDDDFVKNVRVILAICSHIMCNTNILTKGGLHNGSEQNSKRKCKD